MKTLPVRVLEKCKNKGWGLHWTHRGAYLHLEASELIEAIRGKHGDPTSEAADVLFVLMSITEANNIPWSDVLDKCEKLVS
jgi:NTP pyrophosphatase (non-canonical NTP hydrolase)